MVKSSCGKRKEERFLSPFPPSPEDTVRLSSVHQEEAWYQNLTMLAPCMSGSLETSSLPNCKEQISIVASSLWYCYSSSNWLRHSTESHEVKRYCGVTEGASSMTDTVLTFHSSSYLLLYEGLLRPSLRFCGSLLVHKSKLWIFNNF